MGTLGFSLCALAQQSPAPPKAPALAAPASPAPVVKRALAPLDPGAWATRSYRYPSQALISGHVYRERGQLTAPALPPHWCHCGGDRGLHPPEP